MNAMNAEYVVDELRLKALDNPNGGGWVSATNEHYKMLAEQGYAVTDGNPDEDGDIFYRLTDAGRQWLEASRRGETAGEKVEAPKPPKPAKEAKSRNAKVAAIIPVNLAWPNISGIDTDDAEWNKPAARGFGRGREPSTFIAALDLENLPVGASRHIAVTEKDPRPWEKYASKIREYNKQFATQLRDENGKPMTRERLKRGGNGVRAVIPICSYTKKFVIFRAREGDPRGPGARVRREI